MIIYFLEKIWNQDCAQSLLEVKLFEILLPLTYYSC